MTLISTTGAGTVVWEAPAFGTGKPPAVSDLLEIARSAHLEGFTQGHAEGFAQGQNDVRRLVARLESLIDAFIRPLAGLDADVELALATLSTEICSALMREKYGGAPDLLARLVREAITSAGETTRAVEVRLHPEDLSMLRPLLGDVANLTADPALGRGDVRVHADNVRIDARLPTRLKKIIESFETLGD